MERLWFLDRWDVKDNFTEKHLSQFLKGSAPPLLLKHEISGDTNDLSDHSAVSDSEEVHISRVPAKSHTVTKKMTADDDGKHDT